MSQYPELLERFSRKTGYKFVEKHYGDSPLDAKIVDSKGKLIAIAELAVKRHKVNEHTCFMQTIWKLEEGKEASKTFKVPYLIISKFEDADLVYEFSSDHKHERRDGKGKNPREQSAIAASVFIPMQLFRPFVKDMKFSTPKAVEVEIEEDLPLPPPAEPEADYIEEDFLG